MIIWPKLRSFSQGKLRKKIKEIELPREKKKTQKHLGLKHDGH